MSEEMRDKVVEPTPADRRLAIRQRALRAARAVAVAGLIVASAGCGARSGAGEKRLDGGQVVVSDAKQDTLDCSKEWKPGCPMVGPGVPPEMPEAFAGNIPA